MRQSVSTPVGGTVASIDARPSEAAVSHVQGAIRLLLRRAELARFCAEKWRKVAPVWREYSKLDAQLSEARAAAKLVRDAQAARADSLASALAAREILADAQAVRVRGRTVEARAARAQAKANLAAARELVAQARADFAARSPWRQALSSLRSQAVNEDDTRLRRFVSLLTIIGGKIARLKPVSEHQFYLFRRKVHEFVAFDDIEVGDLVEIGD